MNESELRDRLAAYAATTNADPVTAWDRIQSGHRASSRTRRLMPIGALALAVAAVILAVSIAGDGSRVTATGPGGANLPNRPPAIEGTVYGLVDDRDRCGSNVCANWVSTRLNLGDLSVEPASPGRARQLSTVQFAVGKLWGLALHKGRDELGVGIGEVEGSELLPIKALHQPSGGRAEDFAIAEDGRIAWTSSTDARGSKKYPIYHVFEFDPRTGKIQERLRSGGEPVGFGGVAYGPGGQIAVAEIDLVMHPRLSVRLVSPSGESRTIKVKLTFQDWFEKKGDFAGRATLTWSKTGLIAVSDSVVAWGDGDTHIIDARTGKLVRTITNAHAQAWSPDGTGILVVRSKTGRDGRLSVAYGPGLAKEKDLGPLPDALTLRSWVSAG